MIVEWAYSTLPRKIRDLPDFPGIQVLAAAGLISGRRVTCYEHVRLEAEQAGAMYVTDEAVCDGRIVTAQTWRSHPQFYREIFARVSGKSDAAGS